MMLMADGGGGGHAADVVIVRDCDGAAHRSVVLSAEVIIWKVGGRSMLKLP